MSNVVKVYKVKDLETGLYRTAGGGWSKTGKTWNNLGHLKSSISAEGFYRRAAAPGSSKYANDGEFIHALPSENWVIIEVIVQETEGNTRPMADLIQAERRLMDLAKVHGQDFADLVERIEAAGQNKDFQWVLMVDNKWNSLTKAYDGGVPEVLQIIKDLKLKQNKDYKKVTSQGNGGAFAFATKQIATMVRLRLKSPCKSIDIVDYVETDLDS